MRTLLPAISTVPLKIRLAFLFSAFSSFISKNSLPRQPDLSRRINIDNLHKQLLPFGKLVTDITHAIISDLRNMQQAVGTRKNFYKCAKISDALYCAQVGLVQLRNGSDFFDRLFAGLRLFQI